MLIVSMCITLRAIHLNINTEVSDMALLAMYNLSEHVTVNHLYCCNLINYWLSSKKPTRFLFLRSKIMYY